MTHGIDWDAIERARTAAAPEKPLPVGWFRAKDYAGKHGVSNDCACARLRRMAERGLLDREKMGADYAYRIKT
jgi:hypothetical protein